MHEHLTHVVVFLWQR